MIVLSLLCFSWQCVSNIAVSLVSWSPGHSLLTWGTCWGSSLPWRFACYGNRNVQGIGGGEGGCYTLKPHKTGFFHSDLFATASAECGCSCVLICSHQRNSIHSIPTLRCLTGRKGLLSYHFCPKLFLDNLSVSIINYSDIQLCFTRMFSSLMWRKSNTFSKISSQT